MILCWFGVDELSEIGVGVHAARPFGPITHETYFSAPDRTCPFNVFREHRSLVATSFGEVSRLA